MSDNPTPTPSSSQDTPPLSNDDIDMMGDEDKDSNSDTVVGTEGEQHGLGVEDIVDDQSARSVVWAHMEQVTLHGGVTKNKCIHCKKLLSQQKKGTTSHLLRHLKENFPHRAKFFPQEEKLKDNTTGSHCIQTQLKALSQVSFLAGLLSDKPFEGNTPAIVTATGSHEDEKSEEILASPLLEEVSDETPFLKKKRVSADTSCDEVQILGSSRVVSSGPATRQSKRKSGPVKTEEVTPVNEWENLPLCEFAEKLSVASVGMVSRLKAASEDEKKLWTENSKLQAANREAKYSLKKVKDLQTSLNSQMDAMREESKDLVASQADMEQRFKLLSAENQSLKSQLAKQHASQMHDAVDVVKAYKGSSDFEQELKAVIWHVSRFFYTLGADHSAAAGGNLLKLASPNLYVPDLGAAVELCVAALKSGAEVRGVDFIAQVAATKPAAADHIPPSS